MGFLLLSTNEKNRLVKLRNIGNSISEIANKLGRSRATVAKYVKNVPVLSQYEKIWKSKRGGNAVRAKLRKYKAETWATNLLGCPTRRDALLIASCLYWGEGNKKDFGFTNSDPLMINSFVTCLVKIGLDKERLKISIRVYEDIDIKLAKSHWARTVDIPVNKIRSVNILPGSRKGKLPFGMCRIRIKNGNDYFNLLTSTVELISKNYAY